MEECVFCKIISGEVKSYTFWEDELHIAFLSIYPNTEGVTVVVPKQHYPGYAFSLPDELISSLLIATKKVTQILDSTLDDVGRTAMVFEGFGVNHLHSKLYPLHGTGDMREWRPIKSKIDKYFESYEGYISSHDGKTAKSGELRALAMKLKTQCLLKN